jgi:hypothetical protein
MLALVIGSMLIMQEPLTRSTLLAMPKHKSRRRSSGIHKRVTRRQIPNGDSILMTMEFTTAKKSKEPVIFTLDGAEYHFTPHKNAGVVLALMSGDDSAAVKATFDWLSKGLPDEETQRLIDKLNDEND